MSSEFFVILERARNMNINVATSPAESADHQTVFANFSNVPDLLTVERNPERSAEWAILF